MFIGDSFTNRGQYLGELVKNFSDDAVEFNSIGTNRVTVTDSTGKSRTVCNEGRGGWTICNYLYSDSVNNVSNPFYNPTYQKFDFSYYMNTHSGFASPDYVFLMLGTNDLNCRTVDEIVNNFETMVDIIHEYDSNIVVFVSMCIPNYKYSYGDVKIKREKRHDLYVALQNKWSYEYNSDNVILLPMFVNFDPVNDFGDYTNFSYLHSSAENVVRDYTHPNKTGYYKMANTIYYYIKFWIDSKPDQ